MPSFTIKDFYKLGIIEDRPAGPIRFKPNTPVSEIAAAFRDKKIGSTPIVDNDDNFIGVLSERDMAIKLVAESRDSDLVEAKDIMRTKDLAQAREHHTIDYAIEQIKSRGARHITILSEHGKVINFLSIKDFLVAGLKENRNLKKKQTQIVRLQIFIPFVLLLLAIAMYIFDLFNSKYFFTILSIIILTIAIATVVTAKKNIDYENESPY
jgi:CBS domain-containing protein